MTSQVGDVVPFEVEGETAQPATSPSRSTATDEAALTRAAFADRAQAQAELLEARRDEVAAKLGEIESRSHLAKQELQRANESGDWSQLAEKQQEIAQLEAQRHSLNVAADRLARIPTPVDPIEAFISGRAPATQAWLRAHPNDARALALTTAGQAGVDDQRRSAKINAAHNDALAEGFAPDTPGYFSHVEDFLERRDRPGRSTRSSGDKSEGRGQASPPKQVRLTKGEYQQAIDGTICWNSGPLKGKPIGAHEYARRKVAMKFTHPERLG